jgi:DNA polymerase-1
MAKNAAQYDALQGKPAPVLLIDASGLIFRAFYSIRELSSPGGIPINAVYGFLLMFLKVVQDVQTHTS